METKLNKSKNKLISFNEKVHNIHGNKYDALHENDIFNLQEQKRLRSTLQIAQNYIENKGQGNPSAFDFGCGTGNLTRHLLDLNFCVTAADVSSHFLEIINTRFKKTNRCTTIKLDKDGLSKIDDNSFDLIATYSVLHHIPDYLETVYNMIRICKPGGIIYIDHEMNSNYWNPSQEYIEFLRQTKNYKKSIKKWYSWFTLQKYKKEIFNILRKSKLFKNTSITFPLNPRYQPNGDIHVWKDDHIEWNKVEETLINYNCKIILDQDYLFFKDHYPIKVFQEYRNKCSDHKVLIARKD